MRTGPSFLPPRHLIAPHPTNGLELERNTAASKRNAPDALGREDGQEGVPWTSVGAGLDVGGGVQHLLLSSVCMQRVNNEVNAHGLYPAILLPRSLKSQQSICRRFHSTVSTFCVKFTLFLTERGKEHKF